MKYISNQTEFKYEHTAVALGKFEGLHRGHQLLFKELTEYGKRGCQKVVFTFDMPPKSMITGEGQRVIYTKEERWRKLEHWNMDVLIEYPFHQLREMEPGDFVEQILIHKLGAKVIVVGEDFCFGYQRAGNVTMLRKMAPELGYELIVIPKLQYKGEDVSSSRIRKCIESGDMRDANYLLGTPFSITGPVVHGMRNGKSILGMPTANQEPMNHKYLPPNGVYVSEIHLDGDARTYYGISNIGCKPTIDENIRIGVETFIFNFDTDIYGSMMEVSLLEFVRPEMKFDSFEALRAEMHRNAEYGRKYIEEHKK